MAEHARTVSHNGDQYQWCDDTLCMVLDKVTGKPERAFSGNSVGEFSTALEYVKRRKGWEDRMIITRLQCVTAFKLKL